MFDPSEPRNQFQWRPNDLEQWFTFIVNAGWLPYYQAAATASGEKIEYLMAQGSKEGGIYFFHPRPDGRVIGDKGKAFGLHQLHAFGKQTAEDLLPPDKNIPEAARRIAADRIAIRKYIAAQNLKVTPDIEDGAVFAAFNRGVKGEEDAWARHLESPDLGTAGDSYFTDIRFRSGFIRQLLDARGIVEIPEPAASDSKSISHGT